MTMKKLLAAGAMFMLMASTAYASEAAKSEEPIKIGIYLPLTGQNAFGG